MLREGPDLAKAGIVVRNRSVGVHHQNTIRGRFQRGLENAFAGAEGCFDRFAPFDIENQQADDQDQGGDHTASGPDERPMAAIERLGPIDDQGVGRQGVAGDIETAQLIVIEHPVVGTGLDHVDVRRRLPLQDPIGQAGRRVTLMIPAGQQAPHDALAQIEIPNAVNRHRAAGGNLLDALVIAENLAVAVACERHQQNRGRARQGPQFFLELRHRHVAKEPEPDGIPEVRKGRVDDFAIGLPGLGPIVDHHDGVERVVQARHERQGGAYVEGLDDPREVGVFGEHRGSEKIHAAKDDRHVTEEIIRVGPQKTEGVIVRRDDRIEGALCEFFLEEMIDQLEIGRVVDALGVQVFDLKDDAAAFLAEKRLHPFDDIVRPLQALVIGIEQQHFAGGLRLNRAPVEQGPEHQGYEAKA